MTRREFFDKHRLWWSHRVGLTDAGLQFMIDYWHTNYPHLAGDETRPTSCN